MGLADNMASTSRIWVATFACHRLNSTFEFAKCEKNRFRHAVMTRPKSVISFREELKASTVTFESVAKSTLSNCISTNHWSAWNNPRASSTSTKNCVGKLIVSARTYIPFSSRKQTPIPVRFHNEEKAATMLHLKRSRCGFYHVCVSTCMCCPCCPKTEPWGTERFLTNVCTTFRPCNKEIWGERITLSKARAWNNQTCLLIINNNRIIHRLDT